MSKIEEILSDVKHEGDKDPFASLEKTTPPEEEKKSVEVKPDQGESAKEPAENADPVVKDSEEPFHKRWAKHSENLKNELKSEFTNLFETFKQELQQKTPEKESSVVPEWFKKLYGNDEIAWKEYSDHSKAEREEMKKEFLAEQDKQRQEAEQESKKWDKWVDDEVVTLQNKGLKFDRNELIKTILEYMPTDEKGNLSFEKGYKIYELNKQKEIDPAASQARKKIADAATKTTVGDKKSKDYKTPADLRNTSWNKL